MEWLKKFILLCLFAFFLAPLFHECEVWHLDEEGQFVWERASLKLAVTQVHMVHIYYPDGSMATTRRVAAAQKKGV